MYGRSQIERVGLRVYWHVIWRARVGGCGTLLSTSKVLDRFASYYIRSFYCIYGIYIYIYIWTNIKANLNFLLASSPGFFFFYALISFLDFYFESFLSRLLVPSRRQKRRPGKRTTNLNIIIIGQNFILFILAKKSKMSKSKAKKIRNGEKELIQVF